MDKVGADTGSQSADIDLVMANAREEIARCRFRADILQFLADEVEGRQIVRRLQHEARLLNMAAVLAPTRRKEAETLMGECAKIWTGIATARPWAWK